MQEDLVKEKARGSIYYYEIVHPKVYIVDIFIILFSIITPSIFYIFLFKNSTNSYLHIVKEISLVPFLSIFSIILLNNFKKNLKMLYIILPDFLIIRNTFFLFKEKWQNQDIKFSQNSKLIIEEQEDTYLLKLDEYILFKCKQLDKVKHLAYNLNFYLKLDLKDLFYKEEGEFYYKDLTRFKSEDYLDLLKNIDLQDIENFLTPTDIIKEDDKLLIANSYFNINVFYNFFMLFQISFFNVFSNESIFTLTLITKNYIYYNILLVLFFLYIIITITRGIYLNYQYLKLDLSEFFLFTRFNNISINKRLINKIFIVRDYNNFYQLWIYYLDEKEDNKEQLYILNSRNFYRLLYLIKYIS